MNCKQVQQLLSVRNADAPIGDDASERHIEGCAACADFLVDLARLESRLAPRSCPDPPESLKWRITASIGTEPTQNEVLRMHWFARLRPSPTWLRENPKMIRRFSFGVAALLALIFLAALQQAGRAVTPFKRMREAALRVKTIHLIGWNCELRPQVAEAVKQGASGVSMTDVMPVRFEAWIKGGQWREAQDYNVTVYDSGRIWMNGVLVPGEKRPPLLTSFAYRAITGEEPFGKGVAYTTEALGDALVDGRSVTKLVIDSNKPPAPAGEPTVQERRLFWLDSVTFLPIRMEELHNSTGRWDLDAVLWFDYDQPVSNALFEAAPVRSERHKPVDYAQHPAMDLYRLTDEQYAKYTAILEGSGADKQRIDADANLTREQKDRRLVQGGKQTQARLRQIMNEDQRRLFDDWWYIQPKILDKLATPAERAEEANWRKQQQSLMDDWFQSLDAETQQRIGNRPAVDESLKRTTP